MPRRKSDTTFSRRRPQVQRRWILSRIHRKSVEPTQRLDPTLGTDLSVELLCAFPLLTRPSVTAADGGTLDTHLFLIRGVCTVTAGSREVLGAELGSTLTTSLRSKAVWSPRETYGALESQPLIHEASSPRRVGSLRCVPLHDSSTVPTRVIAKSAFHKHRSKKPWRYLRVGRWKNGKGCDKFDTIQREVNTGRLFESRLQID